MASNEIKSKIMKHLSTGSDSWASTIEKVSADVGSQFFTEQAMKELVESGHVRRCSNSNVPRYEAPGNIEGKYADYGAKRLDLWPKAGGPYDYQPENDPLTPKKAV